MTVDQLVEDISTLSVLQVSELVKALEEKFGVSAAAPVAAVAVAGTSAAVEEVEEQTEFDVILMGFEESKKIPVIKEVRAITGLDLKSAKELVEAGGKLVKEGVSKDEAKQVREKLEAAGGKIEVK